MEGTPPSTQSVLKGGNQTFFFFIGPAYNASSMALLTLKGVFHFSSDFLLTKIPMAP